MWCVRRYEGDGHYSLETFATADDTADANGKDVLDFWQAQDHIRDLHKKAGEPKRPITVADAIADYLTWMEGHRKSAQDARYRAEALIIPTLGKTQVADLTAKDIRDWIQKLIKTPPRLRSKKGSEPKFREMPSDDPDALRKRKATANRTATILKAALNHAFREGHVSSDIAWRRVEPFEGVDAARVQCLEVKECQRLVNACEPPFRQLVQAALETGARYSELAAMRVADFHSDNATVTIRQSKSGKPRHIILTDDGAELFKRLTAGRAGSETLFFKEDGSAWGDCHQLRPMAAACKNAKISPPVGFHGLRHTWASLSVMGGMPLMVVARNLGHADTRMVEKHYGHLAPSYVAEAVRASAPRFGFAKDNLAVLR
ncbi:tyrosine-type recombinase/integrase [Mesorhizobium denitrificans]|uniref:tyrosine-type recombinase/integrase n=1 Tax=Mesorhizobium denitrificans TaxID=2294114 RepID=UPI001FE0821F|nr:site-specific integrase [Mesorhizobium denitrificans]